MTGPVDDREVFALEVRGETDVFVSRHAGREVSATVGVPEEDGVRVATAVSELSRDVLAAGGGRVSFALHRPDVLRVVALVDAGTEGLASSGLDAARRLLDEVDLSDDGREVTLTLHIAEPTLLDGSDRLHLRHRIGERVGRSSLDELHTQNRELVIALTEVQARRDELETVNAELEQTSKGVLALYDELSGELETTNHGVVALYAEIDDKSRQLREASESKTRFLRNISHELRTPGNSVLGLSRLLLDGNADPLTDEQRQQVQFVMASAEDLLRLVNELLDLAKAESGRIEAVPEQVDLAEVFAELRGTIAPLTRPGVALDVPPPEQVVELRTDPTLLRHVLRNLLSNAAKFTEAGAVTMTAVRTGSKVVLTVSDTGIGIAEEDQARVFEEFFQVRGELQTAARGTGLGLPFARRLAMILGGDLSMTSRVGEGTSMTLDLPVSGPPPAPPEPRSR